MGQLIDHLKSPQFTDADGNASGPVRMTMVVAPGRPRWLGYAFYLSTFIVATVMALGLVDLGGDFGGDLVQIVGLVAMFGAAFGAWEVWRGSAPSVKGLLDRFRGR
jgi:hypothetical protein